MNDETQGPGRSGHAHPSRRSPTLRLVRRSASSVRRIEHELPDHENPTCDDAERLERSQVAVAARDAFDDCFCVVDGAGSVVHASAAWRNLGADPGAPERARVGDNLLLALESAGAPHAEVAARFARGVRHVLAGAARHFELEWPRTSQTGPRWLLARTRAFEVGGRTFAAIDYRDITVQRGTAEELEGLRAHHWHSDRIARTGVLIASLAHELCQPLAAILSNAQAGLRRIGRDGRTAGDWRTHASEIAEILSDIVADDKRAVQVIESLRLMLRRQVTARTPVDVCDIVHDAARLLRTEFVRRGVQLDVPVADVGSVALVDRAQIQQVLLNVILNGADAMQSVPEGRRRVSVRVIRTGRDEVHISVTDAGVGFTQEQLERSFQAFWTTKLRGTGLGLAVCHSIVTSHGGRMWVEPSGAPGTTLVVALPIHLAPEPSQHEENPT